MHCKTLAQLTSRDLKTEKVHKKVNQSDRERKLKFSVYSHSWIYAVNVGKQKGKLREQNPRKSR